MSSISIVDRVFGALTNAIGLVSDVESNPTAASTNLIDAATCCSVEDALEVFKKFGATREIRPAIGSLLMGIYLNHSADPAARRLATIMHSRVHEQTVDSDQMEECFQAVEQHVQTKPIEIQAKPVEVKAKPAEIAEPVKPAAKKITKIVNGPKPKLVDADQKPIQIPATEPETDVERSDSPVKMVNGQQVIKREKDPEGSPVFVAVASSDKPDLRSGSPGKQSWADIDEADEAAKAEKKSLDEFNAAQIAADKAARAEKLKGFTFAERMKASNVPTNQLDDFIKTMKAPQTAKVVTINEPPTKEVTKPKTVKAKVVAKAPKQADAEYLKWHSIPPESDEFIQAENPTANRIAKKMTSPNNSPQNEGTVTSIGYIMGNGKHCIPKEKDWFLQECETNEEGYRIPIGWCRYGDREFRSKRNSVFVHTLQDDGSYTHEEEVFYKDGSKERIPVTVAYMLWHTTPARIRQGDAPRE